MIRDAVARGKSEGKFSLRPGAADLLVALEAAGCARQILSAGLADVIEAALAELCPAVTVAGVVAAGRAEGAPRA